ncbi:hypothetical protein M3Y97_00956300 [Aphelenchoides bicaudatus]|nr:hypothetical protein M3Y97_00956300 [Aphelenchoides bicaudatus]
MSQSAVNKSLDVNVFAEWESIVTCECGVELMSTDVQLLEVPMLSPIAWNTVSAVRNVGNVISVGYSERVISKMVGGAHDHTHDCVQVNFYCSKCRRTFPCTFDINLGGVQKRFGHYTRFLQIKRNIMLEKDFPFFNRMTNCMWGDYQLLARRNCKTWSKLYCDFVENEQFALWYRNRFRSVDSQ